MPDEVEVIITSDRIGHDGRRTEFAFTNPVTGEIMVDSVRISRTLSQNDIMKRIKLRVKNNINLSKSTIDSSSLVNRKFKVRV